MNLNAVFLLGILCLGTAMARYNYTFAMINTSENLQPTPLILSRKKRYIVFPKGSALQLSFCFTYPFHPVVNIFRFGITAGLAWRLPSEPDTFRNKNKNRRYRRHLIENLETSFQAMGENGQRCTLRALCESGQRTSSKKPFADEILHRLFSISEDESGPEMTQYLLAHQSANQNCASLYPDCHLSVFGND